MDDTHKDIDTQITGKELTTVFDEFGQIEGGTDGNNYKELEDR